jgi:hypothetical protein
MGRKNGMHGNEEIYKDVLGRKKVVLESKNVNYLEIKFEL